ncbi:hypothetical protein O181_022401 [Austropuccinia psidii MF-1]|uniref:Uncharacterized protein n=1 Tax=Austropuccinia psidii MF-1 TaxID=1389203 RepID=A0A9Q3CCS6_9BASI|nr:hypothetical protein [Austropuccinia psidii MF-1]
MHTVWFINTACQYLYWLELPNTVWIHHFQTVFSLNTTTPLVQILYIGTGPVLARLNSTIKPSHENSLSGSGLQFISSHSLVPQAKNTRSQRDTAVLTPTARVPLNRTPSVHQLSENLDRVPPMEGAAPSRRGGMNSRRSRSFSGLFGGYPGMSEGARGRLGEAEHEEGEESVEEEESEET